MFCLYSRTDRKLQTDGKVINHRVALLPMIFCSFLQDKFSRTSRNRDYHMTIFISYLV